MLLHQISKSPLRLILANYQPWIDPSKHLDHSVGVPNAERALIRNSLVQNQKKNFFLLIDHDFGNFFIAVKKHDLYSNKWSIKQFYAGSAAAAAASWLQHNLASKSACEKMSLRILMLWAILPINFYQIEKRWCQDAILACCRKKLWKKLFINILYVIN